MTSGKRPFSPSTKQSHVTEKYFSEKHKLAEKPHPRLVIFVFEMRMDSSLVWSRSYVRA